MGGGHTLAGGRSSPRSGRPLGPPGATVTNCGRAHVLFSHKTPPGHALITPVCPPPSPSPHPVPRRVGRRRLTRGCRSPRGHRPGNRPEVGRLLDHGALGHLHRPDLRRARPGPELRPAQRKDRRGQRADLPCDRQARPLGPEDAFQTHQRFRHEADRLRRGPRRVERLRGQHPAGHQHADHLQRRPDHRHGARRPGGLQRPDQVEVPRDPGGPRRPGPQPRRLHVCAGHHGAVDLPQRRLPDLLPQRLGQRRPHEGQQRRGLPFSTASSFLVSAVDVRRCPTPASPCASSNTCKRGSTGT